MMERRITVRGIGRISRAPDLIALPFRVVTRSIEYQDCLAMATKQVNLLKDAICKAGFEKDDLKTAGFEVKAEYAEITDKRGVKHKVFDGYACMHNLILTFDIDTDRLSKVLIAISESDVETQLSVNFTIKDKDDLETSLLASAAKNAKRKAVALCEAMEAKLGQLIRIDYNWQDINIYSHTQISGSSNAPMLVEDITPDDIDVSDEATFVWEIE